MISRLMQCNLRVKPFDRKPFLLAAICQIRTDALKTYTILILIDLKLLTVYGCCKVVKHIVQSDCKHHPSKNPQDSEMLLVLSYLMT